MENKNDRTKELFGDYPKSVLARFKAYHAKNPQVYEKFKELAFDMRKTGRAHYSAEIIINIMRWHFDLKTKGGYFKICNDYKPLYARLLVFHYPEFETFFRFRQVTSRGIPSAEQRARENGTSVESIDTHGH